MEIEVPFCGMTEQKEDDEHLQNILGRKSNRDSNKNLTPEANLKQSFAGRATQACLSAKYPKTQLMTIWNLKEWSRGLQSNHTRR